MNRYMSDVRRAFVRSGIIQRETSFLAHFAFGAGVGIVTGAAIALLYTPRSGREMRRELGSRAKQLAERTQGALSGARETVRGKAKELRSEARGIAAEAYRAQ